MGILDLFFGKKDKGQNKTQIIDIQKLSDQIVKEKEIDFKKLQKDLNPIFKEINSLISDIRSLVKDLDETEIDQDTGQKRVRKIASTSKDKLIQQMNTLLKELTPPTEGYQAIEDYCLSSNKKLQLEIVHFHKNIAITSYLLKKQMKKLGEYTEVLSKQLEQVEKTFQKHSLKKYKKIQTNLEELKYGIEQKANLNQELQDFKKVLDELNKQKEEHAKKLEELKNTAEAIAYKKLLEKRSALGGQRQQLKNQFLGILLPFEKGFKRFTQMAFKGHYPLGSKEKEILDAYSKNPFMAILKDVDGQNINNFFKKIKELVRDDTITLKDKEKSKFLVNLDEVLNSNYFKQIYEDYHTLQTKENEIEQKIKELNYQNKFQNIQSDINSLTTKIKDATIDSQKIKENREKLEEQIKKVKTDVENKIEDSLNKKYIIRLN